MKKGRRTRRANFTAWLTEDVRGRLPVLASSVAMLSSLSAWMGLTAILTLSGHVDEAATLSQILQPPFFALLAATVVTSIDIGWLHLKFGQLLQLLVHDRSGPEQPFTEEQTARPEVVSLDDEKEPS